MGTLQNKIISQNSVLLDKNFIADKLNTGTLTMILCIGTVLLFLILIILLYILFKVIPYLQEKKSGKSKGTNSTVDHVIAQIVEQEEEELFEDYEFVAVITAAIYAAMGEAVPTDGLIVRSIRKVNSRRISA
jgi:Na+-transporting methylmalonyl-CoA/oxaloacetate decarboxylase gamma subunit